LTAIYTRILVYIGQPRAEPLSIERETSRWLDGCKRTDPFATYEVK